MGVFWEIQNSHHVKSPNNVHYLRAFGEWANELIKSLIIGFERSGGRGKEKDGTSLCSAKNGKKCDHGKCWLKSRELSKLQPFPSNRSGMLIFYAVLHCNVTGVISCTVRSTHRGLVNRFTPDQNQQQHIWFSKSIWSDLRKSKGASSSNWHYYTSSHFDI